MAKKSFKGGLGSLLENTFNKAGLSKHDNSSSDQASSSSTNEEIELYKTELALWRQGQMTPETFVEALKEQGLKYNAQTNTIEKAE